MLGSATSGWFGKLSQAICFRQRPQGSQPVISSVYDTIRSSGRSVLWKGRRADVEETERYLKLSLGATVLIEVSYDNETVLAIWQVHDTTNQTDVLQFEFHSS